MRPRHAGIFESRSSIVMRSALAAAVFAFSAGFAFSGDLDPPGSPAPTMKNLQEIFDQAAQANRAQGGGDTLLFFPYVLERNGSVADTQYTFDTFIYLLATGSQVGQGLKGAISTGAAKDVTDVTVNLYLYGTNGQPALSGLGTPIANPASFTLGAGNPKASVQLETLIQVAGGFASPVFVGFAVLSIVSGDWNDVAVEAYIAHSHSSVGDLDLTPLKPVPIQDSLLGPAKDAAVQPSQIDEPASPENK